MTRVAKQMLAASALPSVLREALAEELADANQDLVQEKNLITKVIGEWQSASSVSLKFSYDLNKYYVTRLTDFTPPEAVPTVVEKDIFVDTNRYWGDDGFKIPSGYCNYLATYSRSSVAYPYLVAEAVLPDLTAYPVGTSVFIGFEHGGSSMTGIASFQLYRDTDRVRMFAVYGNGAGWLKMDVTAVLPANYTTASNRYAVKVNEWGAEFLVNGKHVAFAVDVPGAAQTTVVQAPPYSVGIATGHVVKRLHTLLEILFPYPHSSDIRQNPGSLTVKVKPMRFIWASDVPRPPRAMQLYRENSTAKMAGTTVGSGSVVSHPIPVWGYDAKTLYFAADTAGTLDIQTYNLSGSWRTYDSVTVAAGTPVKYRVVDAALLLRLVFTPQSYPAQILDADCAMN